MYPGSDVRAVERALVAYYEQEASDRAKRPIDPQRVGARTRFITQLDGRRPRVLEVGVGPGRDAASFVAEGIPVVGVDLSVEHAQRASSTGAQAVVATVRRLPFGTSAFAALWTMSTLMHVPNEAITDALVELRRVLAPGALAAVGVWGGPDVEHHRGIDDFDPPRFFSLRSDERWQSLLSTLGSVEDFESWGSARQRLLVPVGHRPNGLTTAPTIATDAHARQPGRHQTGRWVTHGRSGLSRVWRQW